MKVLGPLNYYPKPKAQVSKHLITASGGILKAPW